MYFFISPSTSSGVRPFTTSFSPAYRKMARGLYGVTILSK
jgi:hypothetical protein